MIFGAGVEDDGTCSELVARGAGGDGEPPSDGVGRVAMSAAVDAGMEAGPNDAGDATSGRLEAVMPPVP